MSIHVLIICVLSLCLAIMAMSGEPEKREAGSDKQGSFADPPAEPPAAH